MRLSIGQEWLAWLKAVKGEQIADVGPVVLRFKFFRYQPEPSIHVKMKFPMGLILNDDPHDLKGCVAHFWLSSAELMTLILEGSNSRARNLFTKRKH